MYADVVVQRHEYGYFVPGFLPLHCQYLRLFFIVLRVNLSILGRSDTGLELTLNNFGNIQAFAFHVSEQHQLLPLVLSTERCRDLGRILAVPTCHHMKWVAASWVVARATHSKTPHVSPRTGVDRLLDSDVIARCVVRKGPVGRHPNTSECLGTRVVYVPALIPSTDLNPLPQLVHGGFVVQVKVVQIEATEVAFDL